MEYTPVEREVLNMMQRTDFKNLSKSDVISFASKIGELRPDVAKDIIAQFPEFAGLMKASLQEYKSMFDSIVDSDDSSINEYYNIANKEIDGAAESRKLFYDFVKQVQADCSKLLDKPELSPEETIEILNREAELIRILSEKDSEIRRQEREVEDKVNKKDSEKREFNWNLLKGASVAVIAVAGISASILGGNVNFSLPKRN